MTQKLVKAHSGLGPMALKPSVEAVRELIHRAWANLRGSGGGEE